MPDADALLPVATVARLLHFDRRTITRMCVDGELIATKIRGRWRIQPDSVAALLPSAASASPSPTTAA